MPERKAAIRKSAATKKTAVKKTVAAKTVRPAARRARKTAGAAPAGVAAGAARPTSRRRTKVGRVAAAKTPRTVIVVIERLREHPLYKKVIKVRKRFAVHVADGDVKAGDLVRIQESRPFSATKRWQVIEVLSRAGEAYAAAPQAALVERQLEEYEGVTELLAKPERGAVEAAVEEAAEAADEEEAERQ